MSCTDHRMFIPYLYDTDMIGIYIIFKTSLVIPQCVYVGFEHLARFIFLVYSCLYVYGRKPRFKI